MNQQKDGNSFGDIPAKEARKLIVALNQ